MVSPVVASCALPPSLAWKSLVSRSLEASELLAMGKDAIKSLDHARWLSDCKSLDEFLGRSPHDMMFWFFQRRDAFLSQKRIMKWSRDDLDDYILLPAANGFVSRRECFFISHFWRTPDHPDPDGEYLRLHQATLRPQNWSYIWVDWTCMPQSPRTQTEEAYFVRSLDTVSAIIRNCAFTWFYPAFEARLWILYEVAEFGLTCDEDTFATPDIKKFKDHVQEMVQTSVRSVLTKYSYKCTHERDKAFLTSWLEILVLLKRLRIDIIDVRRLMDNMTWFPSVKDLHYRAVDGNGVLHLSRHQGTLVWNEECYTFTPFTQFDLA